MGKSRSRQLTPELSPQHHFGAEVRIAREAASMTLTDLAAKVPVAFQTLAKVEAGDSPPTFAIAQACDREFPQRQGWFTRFFHAQAGWAGSHRWVRWREIVPLATSLRWYEPSIIPGPLQTEDYAAALIMAWQPDGEVQGRKYIAERLEDQGILQGDSPTSLLVLLDRIALQREVASPSVMGGQVSHLLKVAQQPNVTVQVVSGEGLAGLSGGFAIATHGATDVAAYLDASVRPGVEQDPAMVMQAARLFDHLRSHAYPVGHSVRLMLEAEELWNSQQ